MNPFQAKTVAAAVAPLLRVLKYLEAVVTASAETIKINREDMARLDSANYAAGVERTQANRIIKALSGIIDPKE